MLQCSYPSIAAIPMIHSVIHVSKIRSTWREGDVPWAIVPMGAMSYFRAKKTCIRTLRQWGVQAVNSVYQAHIGRPREFPLALGLLPRVQESSYHNILTLEAPTSPRSKFRDDRPCFEQTVAF